MPRRCVSDFSLKRGDGGDARAIAGALLDIVEEARQHVVAHDLPVRRHVAVVDAVEIAAPDVERVDAEVDAISSMMFSIVIAPCGPPKPRNAVFGG